MAALDPSPTATRRFGRFELRALLGSSQRSMAWRVHDPRHAQDLVLVLPRTQPTDNDALAAALAAARHAARVSHPYLAHAVEVGEAEHWPYIAYDVADGSTLADRMQAREGDRPESIAGWIEQCAAALAFAHDAGLAHHDLQPWLVYLNEAGTARLLGLGVLAPTSAQPEGPGSDDASQRRHDMRVAGERDVLALALILHGLLAAAPALGEPDIGAALRRLAPEGRDPIRLPWEIPRPVPDALRAIANRATDRQVRLRYRNARTLRRALEGWLEVEALQGSDAHAQLLERVRVLGILPALPGAAARAARLALMDRQHTEELARLVMNDVALTLELLRAVNSAQVRGAQVSRSGPVLTIRRAIAMLGLDGVRHAALAMRGWPGPLDERGATDLRRAIDEAQRAARLAQALRPPGYDAEIVALVTLLQNLGPLLLHYHMPDEMRQVRRLMAPAASGEGEQPGMTAKAAEYAVLGSEIDAMALAVARWMGLAGSDDSVLRLMRRLPAERAVRAVETDDDLLRALASAANDAVEAAALAPSQQAAAIERLAKRYARALGLTPRDLVAALRAQGGSGVRVVPPGARADGASDSSIAVSGLMQAEAAAAQGARPDPAAH